MNYDNDNSHPRLGLELDSNFKFEAKVELGLGQSYNSSIN